MSDRAKIFAVDYHPEKGQDLVQGGGEMIAKTFKTASFANFEYVNFHSPLTFGANVSKALGRRTIDRLIILDHGFYTYYSDAMSESYSKLEIGSTRITRKNFDAHQDDFSVIANHTDSYSRVIFLNCFAGLDTALLGKFAKLWNCAVSGSRQAENSLEIIDWFKKNTYATVYPNGTSTVSSQRPT